MAFQSKRYHLAINPTKIHGNSNNDIPLTRRFQWKTILQFEKTNMFLPRVNLCHQKCGMDLLIMQKRKIIYYNLRKIIFSFSFCIKGKSMPPKLWSWNDRNFDQKRSKLFDMDKHFYFLPRVNPCHQNCGMDLHGVFNAKLYHNFRKQISF